MFGIEAIKGSEILMLEAHWGLSPFCRLHLVARLSGYHRIGEYCHSTLISPFLMIIFGIEAIKRSEISTLEADRGLPFLTIVLGSEAIKGPFF